MKFPQKRFLFLSLGIVLLLVSACSSITGAPGSSQTALQILQKSANAMKQLKTAHFTMNLADTVNANTSSSSTSTAPNKISITLKANGDEVTPGQVSLHLTGGTGSAQSINIAETVTGGKVYVQNSKGQWYVLDESVANSASGNPFSNTDISSYNALLTLAQKATFVDHGDQTLNGESLRHITVTFDQNALKDLLNTTGALKNLNTTQQQNINNLLKYIKLQGATLDLWIAENTYYVHQMELKLNIAVNMSAMITPTTTSGSSSSAMDNISTALDTTIDYSKFNSPITITAPANAIPTNNILSAFQ